MTRTITGLYDTYEAASAAVNDLESAGIPHSDISIVANNASGRYADDRVDRADDDATATGTGAGIGGVIGAGGGLLTGLGLMAIPGVGPVVAAGWLVSTVVGALAGAAVGGATGGIIDAMTDAGVPEEHAHVYAEGVRRGGALVTARVDDTRAAEAQAILHRHRSIDPEVRGRAYRDAGWTRFDDTAPAYTADEVERERSLYGGRTLL